MSETQVFARRPARLAGIAGIGVDRLGNLADSAGDDLLRLENLDVDLPPHPAALARTREAATCDDDNSYLPFIGQLALRRTAAAHVARLSGQSYDETNCLVSAGGLSGILNVLLATIEVGDEVIVTDPTYAGLLNRIRLAGGVPRFVPLTFTPGAEWRLARDALEAAINPKTRAFLLTSPSMPSGAVLEREDWEAIAALAREHDLLLILDSAMERLLFDGRPLIHPLSLPGMAERSVVVGSASKELRMIGWRVGWIVSPKALIPDLVAVSLANVVVPVGIAQAAAAIALEKSEEDLPSYVAELQARRDLLMEELDGLPVGLPAGGWSLLLRTQDLGLSGAEASDRLLAEGIAATPMTGWGPHNGAPFVRFVFSNENCERLKGMGKKVRYALGA
ncbi:MAG: pyridoxal phosphate-dependent aminotransferase [Kiloniellales bacterium]